MEQPYQESDYVDMTSTTAAYISTVRPDHTVVLPSNVPIGAKVAIVIMSPDESNITEKARHARFQKMLDAIKAATAAGFTPPALSDAEIDARIERARRATKA
ncbi:MAG: hypothetical protein ACOYNY_00570 [Caldilineaceae bacterium]